MSTGFQGPKGPGPKESGGHGASVKEKAEMAKEKARRASNASSEKKYQEATGPSHHNLAEALRKK